MTSHIKKCEWCQDEFSCKRNDARFCSNSHRQLSYLGKLSSAPKISGENIVNSSNRPKYHVVDEEQLKKILEDIAELTVKVAQRNAGL
jgi:hypothetical protein